MNLTKRVPIRENQDWLVWRGELSGTRRLYLVKEVNPRSPYAQQLTTRLADEYRFLAPLDHPNLVKPLWTNETGTQAAFSDAQCSLSQYVAAHGRITPTLVANVLLMATEALEYLHARRLGHGCVNSHTLLVGPAGDVRFGDFLGYEFGTTNPLPVPDQEPRYQAPELIDSGLGKPGPAADLYCLGYLALELLAGDGFEPLFGVPEGANWLAWHADAYKQLTDWEPVLAHAPTGLTDIIAGLLPKRPADRAFATAAELKTALVRSRLTSDQRLPVYKPPGVDVPNTNVTTIHRPPVRARTAEIEKRSSERPVLVLRSLADPAVCRSFAPATPVLLGSGRKCDLTCAGPGVSVKHAFVACGPDGAWRVFDLATAAGTWVNGAPVRRATLHSTDHLYLGERGFEVALEYRSTAQPFDEFKLVTKLHTGARGRIYRAVWPRKDDREVAVQVFPRRFQFQGSALRRLLRGVPGVASVQAPHLMRVYRAGAERVGNDRVWFLAMEYMPGGSLRERLRAGGRLPVKTALRAVRHAARGAAALGQSGWVHRNINPGCVLFDEAGRAKLGDFFFARPMSAAPVEATAIAPADEPGDLAYLAPECLAGDPASPASDVYSLGATLYESLTGRPPVDPNGLPAEVIGRALFAPLRAPREFVRDLPASVDDLVRRAMARNPGDRFATPAEFGAALAQLTSPA